MVRHLCQRPVARCGAIAMALAFGIGSMTVDWAVRVASPHSAVSVAAERGYLGLPGGEVDPWGNEWIVVEGARFPIYVSSGPNSVYEGGDGDDIKPSVNGYGLDPWMDASDCGWLLGCIGVTIALAAALAEGLPALGSSRREILLCTVGPFAIAFPVTILGSAWRDPLGQVVLAHEWISAALPPFAPPPQLLLLSVLWLTLGGLVLLLRLRFLTELATMAKDLDPEGRSIQASDENGRPSTRLGGPSP